MLCCGAVLLRCAVPEVRWEALQELAHCRVELARFLERLRQKQLAVLRAETGNVVQELLGNCKIRMTDFLLLK